MSQYVKVLQHNGGFISLLADDDGIIQYTTNDADFDGIPAIATVDAGTITNAKLADVDTATFKARTTAGTGSPEDLTVTQATALLNVATPALKGLIAANDKAGLPAVGTNLGNADATIEPFTLKRSKFILPPATLTAARALTIGNTSGTVGNIVQIVCEDLTNHDYVIKDQAAATMFTWNGATFGRAKTIQFYLSGGGWIYNTDWWTD